MQTGEEKNITTSVLREILHFGPMGWINQHSGPNSKIFKLGGRPEFIKECGFSHPLENPVFSYSYFNIQNTLFGLSLIYCSFFVQVVSLIKQMKSYFFLFFFSGVVDQPSTQTNFLGDKSYNANC